MEGESIGGSLVSGVFGLGIASMNNQMAEERERLARLENNKYNELAADAADLRTRGLYEDLYSPAAKYRQIKEAGLSPSVFYNEGATGSAGQTGAMGAGPSGISPNVFGIDPMAGAKIAETLAKARLMNTEADINEGKGDVGEANLRNLLAEAGLKEAETKVANAESSIKDLESYVMGSTLDALTFEIQQKARKAGYDAEIAYEELEQNKVFTEVEKATLSYQVEAKRQQVHKLIQDIAESKSRVQLNEAQKKQLEASALKLYNDITLGWAELDIEQQRSEGYIKYIDKKCELMPQELEATWKDISIKERRMYVDAMTETIKSIAIGAMAASQFKGGNPTTSGPKPKTNGAGGKWNRGGHALDNTHHDAQFQDLSW